MSIGSNTDHCEPSLIECGDCGNVVEFDSVEWQDEMWVCRTCAAKVKCGICPEMVKREDLVKVGDELVCPLCAEIIENYCEGRIA